jgi:hypothetical protein
LYACSSAFLHGQTSKKIRIVGANSLEYDDRVPDARRLIGNVIFEHFQDQGIIQHSSYPIVFQFSISDKNPKKCGRHQCFWIHCYTCWIFSNKWRKLELAWFSSLFLDKHRRFSDQCYVQFNSGLLHKCWAARRT